MGVSKHFKKETKERLGVVAQGFNPMLGGRGRQVSVELEVQPSILGEFQGSQGYVETLFQTITPIKN